MKRAIVYGFGSFYNNRKYLLPQDMEIVAFCVSEKEKATSHTGQYLDGKQIIYPNEIGKFDYDILAICTDVQNADEIFNTLKSSDVDPTKILLLYRELPLVDIPNTQKWEYVVNKDLTIESRIGDVLAVERGGTDFMTLSEIYYQNCYHISLKSNTVVVDMGMNVGFAALFFASHDEVENVYGFEPFPDTYKRACDNIGMNPDSICKKIHTSNIALADIDMTKKVSVITNHMGWRGINDKRIGAPEVEINCRRADKVLHEIIQKHEGKHFVLKIDTEGSEFPIFDVMDESCIFKYIDTIVMEYHDNPQPLIKRLNENGFVYYMNGTVLGGMLYAFNCNNV